MINFILIGSAAVFLVFLVAVALQPSGFRIVRSAIFDAPPSTVFEQVNDLRHWNEWSPWARLDPDASYTFSGPPVGAGARLAWVGNKQVGEGRMTITDSRPEERVIMRLEFFKPFTATNTTEFIFSPHGNQTSVTWSMAGKNNFVGKAMSLVMNCDKMVGGQFDQGFANLRAVLETQKSLTARH